MTLCFGRWRLLLLAVGFTTQITLAQLPNAWQINDNTTSSGVIQYQTNLTAAQVSSAMTNGWRYDLHCRMISDSGSAAAHGMAFGDGVRRFYIFFDLNGAGELTAQLLGDNTYTLTNNPAWVATNYHWHQMTYDPVTSNATYRVDNVVIASWPGQVSVGQSNQVMWGANASAGRGVMNYHRAEFEVLGQGVIASYQAGFAGNPTIAPAPTNQAWTRFTAGVALPESHVSPDTVSGPFLPLATTLAADQFTPDSARLNGLVNPVGRPTVAWFEWGTTTNYGNVTATQPVGSGLTVTNVNVVLGGLNLETNYHFRLVTSNAVGVAVGANFSFAQGSFFLTPISGLPGVGRGSVAWGDYDEDGRLDFLLTGYYFDGAHNYVSQLWRSMGNGFSNVTASVAPSLPGVADSSVAWGDYDNDGWLDFLLTGYFFDGVQNYVSQLWRNTGGGFSNVTASVAPGLAGAGFGSAAWSDYDNDGRPDFLLTGIHLTNSVSQLWRNTGTGFSNVTATVAPGLPGVYNGSVAWGDYDNDGHLDFLLTGMTNGATGLSQLWRNTVSGFSNVTASVAPGLPEVSSVAWGDYDSDGRLDFLLTGYDGGNFVSQLWRNTGGGFSNQTATVAPGLPGVYDSFVAWGDYDNDGRLDILHTGTTADGAYVSQLWRNHQSASNSSPTTPFGLSMVTAGTHAALTWAAANDAQTPTAALSYNLRVGTSPGASDVVSPQSLASGFRLKPALGIVGSGTNRLVPVQFGVTHYWSVQTVDNGFAASAFASEQSFTMNSVLTPPGGIPVPGDQNGDGVVTQSELSAVLTNLNGNGIVSESDLQLVLANYFPNSPWLHLTNVAGLGGTNVTFALSNSLVGAFSVEYTTNLTDWLPLGPATPRYQFTDTNAPASPQRYYRLRWP